MRRAVSIIISGMIVAFPGRAIAVGQSTITMQFLFPGGSPVANQQVTCTDTPPKTTAYPPIPAYTYLTADASGKATWVVAAQDGHIYKCYNRTALTPDNCYGWSGASSVEFALVGGETKNYSFTAVGSGCAPAPAPTTTTTQTTPSSPSTSAVPPSTTPTQASEPSPTDAATENAQPLQQGADIMTSQNSASESSAERNPAGKQQGISPVGLVSAISGALIALALAMFLFTDKLARIGLGFMVTPLSRLTNKIVSKNAPK